MAFDPLSGGLAVIEAILVLTRVLVERGMLQITRKNLDSIRDLKLEILEERNKGDVADQAKIADMYKQMGIYADALAQEIQVAAARKD